jgi:hypothetical protein
MNEKREDRLRRLMEATDENTKAGAIDMACKHYLADLERKQNHIDELSPELVEKLSTPYIPLEREVTTRVGRRE